MSGGSHKVRVSGGSQKVSVETEALKEEDGEVFIGLGGGLGKLSRR